MKNSDNQIWLNPNHCYYEAKYAMQYMKLIVTSKWIANKYKLELKRMVDLRHIQNSYSE